MKKVLHYIDGPYLLITQTWIYRQIASLRRYEPIVYCHETENLDIYPTDLIRSLELKTGFKGLSSFFNKAWSRAFGFYPLFLSFLLSDRPCLVHAHFGTAGYAFLRLAGIFRLPLIATFYGYDLSSLPSQHPEWKARYGRLFREGKAFLVEGSNMKETLIKLGCPREKAIVQHLGIDTERIRFEPRTLRGDGEVRILISAHFREKKGIPYAVEAFGRVKQSLPGLNLKMTIIGDSKGDPEQEEEKRRILEVIRSFGMEKDVVFLGYQPHSVFLKEVYRHHIFLQPSIRAADGDIEGGAPVSITEASASGMPVLATNHCDIPEVVIDGESGFLVAERDVDALTERLEFLVTHSETWETLGLRGREHIEKHYSAEKQAHRLEEIYDTILNA